MMIRKPDGTICLLDLKTSKPDGGGKIFLPQYEVQVIGYSWVTQQAGVGTVSKTGLVYCDIQVDQFKSQPLKYKTATGIMVPFDFKIHEVKLDFSRLTECLKEVKKIWNSDRPPKGTDGCKDCQLLTRLPDKNAFGLRKINKMNSRVPSLKMPFKKPILTIWAQKCPFVTVHIQCGSALAVTCPPRNSP